MVRYQLQSTTPHFFFLAGKKPKYLHKEKLSAILVISLHKERNLFSWIVLYLKATL